MRISIGILTISFGLILNSVVLVTAQATPRPEKCALDTGPRKYCASSHLSNADEGAIGRVKGKSRLTQIAAREGRSSTAVRHQRRAPAAYDVTSSLPNGRDNGRDLTVAELAQLYGDRTWIWSEGGGYFAPNGGFYAAVGADAPSSYLARGKWQTGPNGEMCFQALWSGQSGKSVERTCFYHRIVQGKILQKKGDAGTWYVFKGNPGRKDEFNKILPGDHIQSKFNDVRAKYLYGILM
jgi:hypothetical protein